ncbi:unnamed protein product, partial [Brassica oleracea]
WILVSCRSLTLENLPTDPHLPLDLPLPTNLLPLQTFHLLQILFHQRSFNLGHYHCFFFDFTSPLSVLFTRIIPDGRSKPEIFFKLHCILSQRFLAFYSLSFSSKMSSSRGFVGAWFWVFQ